MLCYVNNCNEPRNKSPNKPVRACGHEMKYMLPNISDSELEEEIGDMDEEYLFDDEE